MSNYKAKYIGCSRDRGKDAWQRTYLHYEYRGHTYIVTRYNNGYSGTDTSLRRQHEKEQRRIDELIEHENDPHPVPKYEGSAQEGFDLFWNYVEGNDWEG